MRLKILRLLSFYFPISKKFKSEYSGVLELKFVDGKVLLDNTFSSCSYGPLQKVLEFALHRVDLSTIHSVLLLGLGGGSVIRSLRKRFRYDGRIDAIEIDPVLIKIADEEFGIVKDGRTQIECCEASTYVAKTTKTFDLVIVDLFIDNRVSVEILSEEFWCNLKDKVSSNGYIIFNSMHDSYAIAHSIRNEIKKWGFSIKEYNHVEFYNSILIAKSAMTWFG
jgi:spermidine synthase